MRSISPLFPVAPTFAINPTSDMVIMLCCSRHIFYQANHKMKDLRHPGRGYPASCNTQSLEKFNVEVAVLSGIQKIFCWSARVQDRKLCTIRPSTSDFVLSNMGSPKGSLRTWPSFVRRSETAFKFTRQLGIREAALCQAPENLFNS